MSTQQQLPEQPPVSTITKAAEDAWKNWPRFRQLISPSIPADWFIASVIAELNAIRAENYDLRSLLVSIANCGSLGLIPGQPHGHAFFVPYRSRKAADNGKHKFSLIVGYQGYQELAFSNGFLRDLHTDVVLQGEDFSLFTNSDGQQMQHVIPIERELGERSWENIVAAYCVYHTTSGGRGLVVVPKSELARVNTRRDIWASHPVPMCKKTAVLRARKNWRVSRAMAMATMIDEQAERDEDQTDISGAFTESQPRLSLESFS